MPSFSNKLGIRGSNSEMKWRIKELDCLDITFTKMMGQRKKKPQKGWPNYTDTPRKKKKRNITIKLLRLLTSLKFLYDVILIPHMLFFMWSVKFPRNTPTGSFSVIESRKEGENNDMVFPVLRGGKKKLSD
jgi:hypothetical protein